MRPPPPPLSPDDSLPIPALPDSPTSVSLIGGRLSVNFANLAALGGHFSWENLLHFLLLCRIISPERSAQLLALPRSDPSAADSLLRKADRLRASLRESFGAIVRREIPHHASVEPINEVLRVTEGHDELVQEQAKWQIEFIAREGGLDWLLAAIARSGADIIAEVGNARLRACANPQCGLFFYDASRTHRRRWCSMARCGNRHKVAAFARRRASQ